MKTYSDEELLKILESAVINLSQEDGFPLGKRKAGNEDKIRKISERTIAQRISLYLQPNFKHHYVDCEYNRNKTESKELYMLSQHLSEYKKEEIRTRTIKRERKKGHSLEFAKAVAEATILEGIHIRTYPDIIVHERLELNNDLMVVEIKCSGDRRGAEGEDFDKKKIKLFTLPPYNYQLGIFLKIYQRSYHIEVFKHGQQHPDQGRKILPKIKPNDL